jgi:hypothetical protein
MIFLLGQGFVGTLIQRIRGWLRPNPRHTTPIQTPAVVDWVVVDSATPPALAAMYQDVLRQHGIPAVVRSEGVGRGAMGGVPMDVRLLVPAEHAAEARELLRGDDGVESERIEDGGER